MAAMVRTALAAICAFTLLATAYLTGSLLILRPPRANDQQWTLVAAVILVQAVNRADAHAVRASRWQSQGSAIRWPRRAVRRSPRSARRPSTRTVSGPHFEGYALVLGSMLVIQGLLTLITFAGLPAGAAAQLRH